MFSDLKINYNIFWEWKRITFKFWPCIYELKITKHIPSKYIYKYTIELIKWEHHEFSLTEWKIYKILELYKINIEVI